MENQEQIPLSKMTGLLRRQLVVGQSYTVVKKSEPFSRWNLVYRGDGKEIYPEFPEYHNMATAFFGNESPPCNTYMNLPPKEWLYLTEENLIPNINEEQHDKYIPIIHNFIKNSKL